MNKNKYVAKWSSVIDSLYGSTDSEKIKNISAKYAEHHTREFNDAEINYVVLSLKILSKLNINNIDIEILMNKKRKDILKKLLNEKISERKYTDLSVKISIPKESIFDYKLAGVNYISLIENAITLELTTLINRLIEKATNILIYSIVSEIKIEEKNEYIIFSAQPKIVIY